MKASPWLLLVATLPAVARAAAYDVEARTDAQADTVAARSPSSGQALFRRRLVQSLDLAGFELVGGEDAGLSLRLRFDADFAVREAELGTLDDAARARLQLLGGRFHWNGLSGGRLDVEAGRITWRDAVGSWRLDGGRATLRPLPWLALSAFGGWRVTAASWLAATALTPDGTRASDRLRLAAGAPAIPCAAPTPFALCADDALGEAAPSWGGRLALLRIPGLPGASAEAEYRRTTRGGAIVEERAGGAARWRGGAVAAEAAGEVDLYLRRLTLLRAALRLAAAPTVALALEGLHAHPAFSADSIWNLFTSAPTREARLRADWTPAGPVRLWASAGLTAYAAPAFNHPDLAAGQELEPAGALGLAADLGPSHLECDGSLRAGPLGSQGWLTAVARRELAGWLLLEGRATLARMTDRVAPKNGGTFPALALAATARLERRARAGLLLEDSAPRGERNDVRLFAFLALGADWDGRMAR